MDGGVRVVNHGQACTMCSARRPAAAPGSRSSIAIPESRNSLAWDRIVGTKRRVIAERTRTKTSPGGDPTWGKLEASCVASVWAGSRWRAAHGVTLEPPGFKSSVSGLSAGRFAFHARSE